MMSISNGNINENSNGVEPIRILNPFVHKLEVNNPLDQLKTVILTILLLPFRVISICLLLVIAWLLACIGLYGLNSEELQTKPLTGWRRRLKNVICIVGRWSYLAGGIGITVKGQQVHRNQAPILVIAPHSTFLDSVIVYVTRMSSVIVRNESMDNFAGKLINFTQPIYVWRDDPNSRHNTIQSIIDRANSKDDWPQILIFPEGTCTNRSCLITFKPGAFYPGVPIQPVCIRYPNKLDTVTWTWEGPGVLKLLWLTLTQFHSSCEVEFLPVYHPSDEEKINPKLFAHNVRNVMAKALGIPTSEYTYDDVRRLTRCKLMNNPYASSIVEIEKLRIKSGLHLTNIEEQVITLVNDNNCHVTLSEFALRLQIPPADPAAIALYAIFKKPNSDAIDFREYLLCALFLLKMNEPTIKLMHYVFKMYENCGLGQGRLSQTAFYGALKNTLASSIDESNKLFMEIDKEKRGYVTYDEFRLHLEQKMECAKLFDPSDYRPSSVKVKLN